VSRGAFITFEGIEGVGKSTSIAFVRELLEAAGRRVVVTREPGGTALGEKVREWVLGSGKGELSAQVEALLMFAARAHHLDRVVRPALTASAWVVCDRFTDATLAYQGGGRGADPTFLARLRDAVHGDLEPDLTVLFDAPVDVGLKRIAHRAADHFESEDASFFERVRQAYLDLAAKHPDRIKVVDAALSLDTVQASLGRHVSALLERWNGG
jgi:dTMP kinase